MMGYGMPQTDKNDNPDHRTDLHCSAGSGWKTPPRALTGTTLNRICHVQAAQNQQDSGRRTGDCPFRWGY